MKFYFEETGKQSQLESVKLNGTLLEGICSNLEVLLRRAPLYVENKIIKQEVKYTVLEVHLNGEIKLDIVLSGILNRRKAYRISYNTPCTVKMGYSSLEGIITDLSVTGVRLITEKPIDDIEFMLCFNLEKRDFKVFSTIRQSRYANSKYEYGVTFNKLSYSDDCFIAKLTQSTKFLHKG